MLSSGMQCYHLELMLSSGIEMLSSGMKCYHLELMLSSATLRIGLFLHLCVRYRTRVPMKRSGSQTVLLVDVCPSSQEQTHHLRMTLYGPNCLMLFCATKFGWWFIFRNYKNIIDEILNWRIIFLVIFLFLLLTWFLKKYLGVPVLKKNSSIYTSVEYSESDPLKSFLTQFAPSNTKTKPGQHPSETFYW